MHGTRRASGHMRTHIWQSSLSDPVMSWRQRRCRLPGCAPQPMATHGAVSWGWQASAHDHGADLPDSEALQAS